ncbi:MAG: TrkA C-terminal domain-containing protein [Woeseiaceae bacterium]
MGAAITLLVILTVSVLVVRIAAVALRLTGMPADVARFQARSAFSGAGFTTSESEAVVNHPIRRRLIGLLMLWGNIGLVTVIATFIVSFIGADNSMAAMSVQLFWLLGAIALLWLIALNPYADRVMCSSIGWLLQRTTSLGQRGPTQLLQISSAYSVSEHTVHTGSGLDGTALKDLCMSHLNFLILGVEHDDGRYSSGTELGTRLRPGDRVVLYASDEEQSALNEEFSTEGLRDADE